MTKEKILEKLLMIKPEYGYNEWAELVEAMKQDIRDENNRRNGKANCAKLAKNIMKNAPDNSPKFKHAKTIDGIQYVLDGHRIACFFDTLDLPEWTETPDWFGVADFMDKIEYTTEALTLPSISELKAAIKIAKAEKKPKCSYVFQTEAGEKVMVDARYLLEFMEGFREMKLYPAAGNVSRSPLYIESPDGAGVLLPIVMKEDREPGFHSMS